VKDFEVLAADVDEEALTSTNPWTTAISLAAEKAYAVSVMRPEAMVIGGDTVVAVGTAQGYEQLAKPADEEDAVRMLSTLSGREHLVITGICVRGPALNVGGTETTAVVFEQLSHEQIARYVRSGEPMDKAGAYAIQGGAKAFVDHIVGPEDNVIGLPLGLLERLLKLAASPPR
jgi:septum formation protein